jgi:uncharacterized protein (DUF488 family)
LDPALAHPFFTIGHSTHAVEELVSLLLERDIGVVVDVRSLPRSRRNPQFNREVLPRTLTGFGLDYVHIPELGGLRGRSLVPPSVNGFWTNDSFHNYADYAMSKAFHSGVARLRALGRARRCVIMCAEAMWWRCHRRIIVDYLLAAGETVIHILAKGRQELASSTAAARPGPRGTLVYPGMTSPLATPALANPA